MTRNRPRFLDRPSELPPNLAFVFDLSPSAMTLGLANIRALMAALDHPERRFRSVVVAGTNGKGSTTAYLSALLQAAGLKVGWFSSPHIYSVRERIRINGAAVSLDEMEEGAARLRPLYDKIGYSYFEAVTAIAYQLFAEHDVDVAVLETGLGGRFDATNVVEPVVSIITSIGLDHRRILGDTEEEILREKLGIARPGVPLLTGPLSPALAAIVSARAQRDEIPLRTFDSLGSCEVVVAGFDGAEALLSTTIENYGRVPLPFVGQHQAANALLAVAAAEILLRGPAPVAAAAALTDMPGRFEVVRSGDRTIVLDVGHNDDALLANLKTLGRFSPRENNALVLGVLRRKEFERFPGLFTRWVSRLYLVEPTIAPSPVDRLSATATGACSSVELLKRIGLDHMRNQSVDVVIVPAFSDETGWPHFMSSLLATSNPCLVSLVTGSHHTVELAGRGLHKLGVM